MSETCTMSTTRTFMTPALCAALLMLPAPAQAGNDGLPRVRRIENFNHGWRFSLGCIEGASRPEFDDSAWRVLDVPHDWSVEGTFLQSNASTPSGGALPGGVGWYRKAFQLPDTASNRVTYIEFDGIYCNSEVWLNGHYLGRRPNGYISYRLNLTPYLLPGLRRNLIAVRVDNSMQPNSRWYSGSGIYRNVRLVQTDPVAVDQWGVAVTASEITAASARISVQTALCNAAAGDARVAVINTILDPSGEVAARISRQAVVKGHGVDTVRQSVTVKRPDLWSVVHPALYRVATTIECDGRKVDDCSTSFGIRFFRFDVLRGFFLNGDHLKINGVCNHHDMGCLGTAVNARALERQLEIMRAMGVNAIRTSHNPPAPELLELCDRMGFLVMDEAFDMWRIGKTPFDYSHAWDEWHRRDLEDQVLRDRNHPSVIIWSIGNEVREQKNPLDTTGSVIARELCGIVRALDATRPITANCNTATTWNPVLAPGILDLVGFSYNQKSYPTVLRDFPGRPFIASETVSSLASRGWYEMPADSIRRWPTDERVPFLEHFPANTCSAYDNVATPWGNTQEEAWNVIRKLDWVSGQFIWTGFDYLGEPTPFGWPSRSSYFGLVDLAGFPKDTYYMYQSEWTTRPVLHLLPHWNWKKGDTVDVWAYTNAPEVELFLNGVSAGVRSKKGEELHIAWKVPFVPGTLHAVGRSGGKDVMTAEVRTAGPPAAVILHADRSTIAADGNDLSFVTVSVVDSAGTVVPAADNLVEFSVGGPGSIAGVDNGSQTSHESFRAPTRSAYNGLCLAVIRSTGTPGRVVLTARSQGLREASITVISRE